MSLKHAILGFLSIKPLSGYDLKKAFDNSVQHFWPAHQSQIYRTLYDLADEGLVEQEVIPREQRLDVKLYHITEAGREELHDWLSTPLPPQETREPFLIQLFFGLALADDVILENLQHERAGVRELLELYRQMYQDNLERRKMHENKRGNFYSMLTLEYGVMIATAGLRWLDDAIARIERGDYTPKTISELFSEEG